MSTSFKASAPGSFFWMGEHAILHEKKAIVSSTDCRVSVTIIPQKEAMISIDSSLGKKNWPIEQLDPSSPLAPFAFVLYPFIEKKAFLPSGCIVKIESNFSSSVGLASSAAVTVATVVALQLWLGQNELTLPKIFHQARNIVKKVQKVGSGADVAASVFGGMIQYCGKTLSITRLDHNHFPPFFLTYSGSKTATPTVIAKVEKKRERHPDLFALCFDGIDRCVQQGWKALWEKDWTRLGEIMNIHQGFLDALDVNDGTLSEIIFSFRQHPSVLGCKISGSGLGDCILSLGSFPSLSSHKEKKLDVAIGQQGVSIESARHCIQTA